MGEKYNFVGKQRDDIESLLIGIFDTREDAEQAVKDANEQDPHNNWKFDIVVVPEDQSYSGYEADI